MKAIVLAAGIGKRLRKFTKDGTKCLVKVNCKVLIEPFQQKEEVENRKRKGLLLSCLIAYCIP